MPVLILFTLLLLLTGCKEETANAAGSKQAEVEARQQAEARQKAEARQQAEVRQQAEQAQRLADERRDRLQTLRIVAFVVLAGVAVAAISLSARPLPRPVFDHRPGQPQTLPRPGNGLGIESPPGISRIIELPPVKPVIPPQPQDTRAAPPQGRRRRKWHHRPDTRRDNPYHQRP